MAKCRLRHPPGTEIYRDRDISVFEVSQWDGRLCFMLWFGLF